MAIRPERPRDIPAVRTVNDLAFGRPAEGPLVNKLRQACPEALSLVAEEKGRIVGHIPSTPAVIARGEGSIQGMGPAPTAVLPDLQLAFRRVLC